MHGVSGERPMAPQRRVVEPMTIRDVDLSVYDAVIATGHQTAPWVAAAGRRGFYFLQGDERALSPQAEATWDLPLTRFAVSGWLADLVRQHGHPVVGVVPNAVDPTALGCDVAPVVRPARVVALYHRHPVKGPTTLIRTLDLLRDRVPGVRAAVVSARPPSHRMPGWVDLHVRPSRDDLRALYNGSSVCLHTSAVEGWGLVPMEAAACGCAVVATASRGPREFLTPGVSMVEVPVGDASALAEASADLLMHPVVREEMALAGVEAVGRFSWSASTGALEQILEDHAP